MKPNSFYKLRWGGPGFGDRLAVAGVVNILNENGIKCGLWSHVTHNIVPLVDCPRATDARFSGLIAVPCNLHRPHRNLDRFVRGRSLGGESRPSKKQIQAFLNDQYKYNFYTDILQDFLNVSGTEIELKDIKITLDQVPIKYKEMPEVKGVDVAMVTQSGRWTPYRNWPYFKELKRIFKSNGISFIDLSQRKIKNFKFLNYVKKSKVYLGLETGASHYASAFSKGKGFIIQSGYCDFDYWAGLYNYEKINRPVPCSPCWLTGPPQRGPGRNIHPKSGPVMATECPYSHVCMQDISPEEVYQRIKHKL